MDVNPFWVIYFSRCLQQEFHDSFGREFQCAFKMNEGVAPFRTNYDPACGSTIRSNGDWALTSANWESADTNDNLQTFIAGGVDAQSLYWSTWNRTTAFTQTLGLELLSNPNDWSCRLNDPCAFSIDCREVGAHQRQLGAFRDVIQSRWAFFVLRSIKNVHLQLSNHFQALQSAAIKATLEAFDIAKFRPPDDTTALTPANVINSLSQGFAVIGGFAESKAIDTAKGYLEPLSIFFSNRLGADTSTASQNAQRDFSLFLRATYTLYEEALQNITSELFQGTTINEGKNSFNISDLISNGSWVSPTQLEDITVIEERIRVEVLSRSINALWLLPANGTKNKMWVTFYDLQDDKNQTNCAKDRSGPLNFKYCADGGVYYGYNFVEQGDHLGKLGFPWGANHLDELSLNPNWTVQSSARTYRALRNSGMSANPFNFSDISALSRAIAGPPNGTDFDTKREYGRLPGTWTLPVCDISGYGKAWNIDYTNKAVQPETNPLYPGASSRNALTHPPCLCGSNGNETKLWVKAAGMLNFGTFYDRCRHALADPGFEWPNGLKEIDYDFGSIIKNPNP